MNEKSRTSSARSAAATTLTGSRRRQAMTLVEVVGALVLLGTLLVALLTARARYTRQSASSDRRLRAVAAADELLTEWRRNPASLPRSAAGRVARDSDLAWRTLPVPNAPIQELGGAVVRLEIVDERPTAADPIVASVEFVVEPEPARAAATAPVTGQSAGTPTARKSPKPSTPAKGNKSEKSLHHP
jgi:type II secretory pathway pseudopilin PulG